MSEQELIPADRAPVMSKVSDDLSNVWHLGKLLASSGFFADATQAAQAAVKVMAGRELGIPPVASMMGVNIIKGKVALSGNLIASRIRTHGYDYRVTRLDSTGCVLKFLGKPDLKGKRDELGDATFTEAEAKTAGVFNDMYRKYPRNMYFNRAISNGAKWFTPEVSSGMPVYVPEELGADVDGDGDVVRVPAPAETRDELVKRRIAETKENRLYMEAPPPEASISVKPEPSPETKPEPKSEVPAELAEIWKRMTNFEAIVKEFQRLKYEIEELAGTDLPYYSVLLANGMQHANDLKGQKKGELRLIIRDLWLLVQKCKAEPPADEIPEDLAEAIAGTIEEGENV